jgi:sporulation protein YlmC with PRC-barrel domain
MVEGKISVDKSDLKMTEEKKFSKQLIGKTVISKSGKRFGEVGDIIFEARSGELIHIVLVNPTTYIEKLELEKTKEGNILVPFSAVIAVGDFVVLAEEDII